MTRERFAIKSDRLVLPSGIDGFGYLVVSDGRFQEVSVNEPADIPIVDHMGHWVAPGFFDTHIHGYAGHDVMDCDAEGLEVVSAELARRGTTSWLATTLTAPVNRTAAACAAAAAAEGVRQPGAARIQGIHLEGPHFTAAHKGAQDERYLTDPSLVVLDRLQEAAGGMVVKSSLAPEREGAVAYIQGAVKRGVTCSLGHSSATYGEAVTCVLAGARSVTHTFNGMDDMGHREPGLVGLAMTSQGVYAELIADGFHVDPVACEALVRAKGFEHVVLITDCLSCGGLVDGAYKIGELDITLAGGVARLKTGNLAGSTLTMAKAVKNVVDWGIVTAEQAIRMASEVPARSVSLDDRCGQILPGRDADLTILDGDLNLVETYVGGVSLA